MKKKEWHIFMLIVLFIGLSYGLSKLMHKPLLFNAIYTFIGIIFMIYAINVLLNDLVNIENFEDNFWVYTFTYLVVVAIGFYFYISNSFNFDFFIYMSISLFVFWVLYLIACINILYKLNVGEKKIWWITIIKSLFGSLGAWGAIAVLLFSTGNCDIKKSFFLATRILSSGAAFFYPILDMYLYTHQKISEYQKSVLKEKKKETSGNKKHTA